MIVGITGFICAGKGTLKNLLVNEYGFNETVSFYDVVREELVRRGIEENRNNLQYVGDMHRKKTHGGIWAERIIEKTGKRKLRRNDYVIEGIRNPEEIIEFRRLPTRFVLVGINAPASLRWRRMQRRGRAGDPRDLKEFMKIDMKDKGVNQGAYGQHTRECYEMADYRIPNNGTLEDLKGEVDSFLEEYR